ncbi:MAG: radical SAM protein, partial [Propionibacteriaceae bacterium]|nr:radical SAM protein [Propionibacteriaceae bacterium]
MSDDSSLEADQPSAEAGEVGPRPLDSGRRPAGERPSQPPRHWADADPVERVEAVTAADMPAFRARQLNAHYFGHWSDDPLTWTDLSASHRQQAERFFPQLLSLVRSQRADDGATLKNLYRLHDGSLIETVIMRYLRTDVANRPPWPTEVVASTTGRSTGTRTTLCISTQVGCGMGCAFCATGQLGLSRNLSVGEILEQVRLSGQALAAGQVAGGAGRVSHIVFMGMGEPLANYEATVRALHQLTAPAPTGFGLSARGIT